MNLYSKYSEFFSLFEKHKYVLGTLPFYDSTMWNPHLNCACSAQAGVGILIKGLDEEISFRGAEVMSGRHRRTGGVFDENVDAGFRTLNGIYASFWFHFRGGISKFRTDFSLTAVRQK